MAHIVTCMVDPDGDRAPTPSSYIGRQISPQMSTDSLVSVSSASSDERKQHIWRMQPAARTYQLFPKDKQLSIGSTTKKSDWENTMSQSPVATDKPSLSGGLRSRIKEHSLIRRRKVSVPELGPMTTVQEIAMDSPTIPGRPALHERSMSSPVNALYHQTVAEDYAPAEGLSSASARRSSFTNPRVPPSPRGLTPLVIPTKEGPVPQLAHKPFQTVAKAVGPPSECPVRPPRPDESPMARTPFTPYTPLSASATPRSAATVNTLPTPLSASTEARSSPKPCGKAVLPLPPQARAIDPLAAAKAEAQSQPRSGSALAMHTRSGSAASALQPRSSSAMSHRRGQSDTGGIMDRGRPRKRTDGSAIGGHQRMKSKSISQERRDFEYLPSGCRIAEVATKLDPIEATYLQKQALSQALRFEILKKEDVDSLSKELRYLDDRAQYLRSTYASLRTGRRNLHVRVCQYLRSPRVAKFSYDAMLKQEEALADLDASIDDWVTKLEQVENRRTRVRQKLLEHVAAAATLSLPSHSELKHAARSPSTPPRSPTKVGRPVESESPSSRSPQRVVARVPSAILELPSEELECAGLNVNAKTDVSCEDALRASSAAASALQRMESIRIYADSDVYDLLADVENEFTKLNGEGVTSPEPVEGQFFSAQPQKTDDEQKRRELHRARSHELLMKGSSESRGGRAEQKTEPSSSPQAPTPPKKDSPTHFSNDDSVLLTSAVFQPGRSALVI